MPSAGDVELSGETSHGGRSWPTRWWPRRSPEFKIFWIVDKVVVKEHVYVVVEWESRTRWTKHWRRLIPTHVKKGWQVSRRCWARYVLIVTLSQLELFSIMVWSIQTLRILLGMFSIITISEGPFHRVISFIFTEVVSSVCIWLGVRWLCECG